MIAPKYAKSLFIGTMGTCMPSRGSRALSTDAKNTSSILPASLFGIQDTIKQHKEAKRPILEAEIARRECEIVLLKSHRMLLRLQLWSAFQTAIIAGLIIFSFGIALIGIVQVAKFVDRVGAWNATLTNNVLTRGVQREVQNLIPTSTVLQVADYIPFWDLRDATLLSALVALIILTLRVVQGVSNWRDSHRLKLGARVLEEEVNILRNWLALKE